MGGQAWQRADQVVSPPISFLPLWSREETSRLKSCVPSFSSRSQLKQAAKVDEHLIPIRLDFEEPIIFRDTFTWNALGSSPPFQGSRSISGR